MERINEFTDSSHVDGFYQNSSKIMFGWAHTVQNIDFTSDMIRKKQED